MLLMSEPTASNPYNTTTRMLPFASISIRVYFEITLTFRVWRQTQASGSRLLYCFVLSCIASYAWKWQMGFTQLTIVCLPTSMQFYGIISGRFECVCVDVCGSACVCVCVVAELRCGDQSVQHSVNVNAFLFTSETLIAHTHTRRHTEHEDTDMVHIM